MVEAVITGIVGLFSAYASYRAAVVKAEKDGTAVPAKPGDAAKGEQVAHVIEAGIQQHGDESEKTALQGFYQNPQMYAPMLTQVLQALTERNPTFAQQLQQQAQQVGVQQGSVTGTVSIHGNNYGQSIGVMSGGTITSTYHGDTPKPPKDGGETK